MTLTDSRTRIRNGFVRDLASSRMATAATILQSSKNTVHVDGEQVFITINELKQAKEKIEEVLELLQRYQTAPEEALKTILGLED